MNTPLKQHDVEIEANQQAWRRKDLLRTIYQDFYARIADCIDRSLPQRIVEIGSGLGNLSEAFPGALSTDLFLNPWLDLVCDGYELPFASNSLGHLVLFDVFHHIEVPAAFLAEARRVLVPGGRVILFEPFISWASYPVYGLLHHEPIGDGSVARTGEAPAHPRSYYAAQGNATKLFFDQQDNWHSGFELVSCEAFSSFAYLMSGGFSKPSLYPRWAYRPLKRLDRMLSAFPRMFGARCIVCLSRTEG